MLIKDFLGMSSIESNNLNISNKLPWLAATAMFMQSLDATILNTALPTIAKDLNHSEFAMQGVVVAYSLTLALLIPVSGWLSDKYGTKKIFSFAIFMFTLGSLACAFAKTFDQLVVFRIVQAIGGSMMLPVSRLALLYAYPKNQLLRVMNFVTMPGLVGPLVGPVLGGWLVDVASWHWIFLINIPIGVAGFILTHFAMPNFKRKGLPFDYIGFVLFSSALVCLSLALEAGNGDSFDWSFLAITLIIAIIAGTAYIYYSRRVKNALLNLSLMKIRTLRIGLLGNLCTRLGIGSIPFILPQMIQIAFDRSAAESGLIMMSSAITTIFAKSQVVPIVARFGYKKTIIMNTLILAVAIAMLAIPNKDTSIFVLISILFVYGAVNSIQMSTMNTLSLADLTPDVASSGNTMLAITQQLSLSFGVSVGAMILRITESTTWLTHGNIGLAFKYTFISLGIITIFSSLIFAKLKNTDGDDMAGHKS